MAKAPYTRRRRRLGGVTRVSRRRSSNPGRLVALLERDGAAMTFRVARKLDSPNSWRAHWSIEHTLRKWWEGAFTTAIAVSGGFGSLARMRIDGQMPRVDHRVKLTLIRQVPSTRNFIRDEDDLYFTRKPVNDALKRIGLIRDDRREWLDQAQTIQEVSPDGLYWTIVRVEPAEAGAAELQQITDTFMGAAKGARV